MMNVKRLNKKLQKAQALENGRRQFEAMVRPQRTAYVQVNSIVLPTAIDFKIPQ